LALELTSTGLSQHHCRTDIIANKTGRHIGLQDSDQQTLTYAALLHDLGAAANWEEKHDLVHFSAGPNIHLHAEKGYELLKGSPQLGVLANPIRYHHYRFDGNNPGGLSGEDIPLLARIIFLADRIEILIREDMHIFDQCDEITGIIQAESGRCFDPLLVTAFHELSINESFWLDMVNTAFHNKFFQTLGFYGKMAFDDAALIPFMATIPFDNLIASQFLGNPVWSFSIQKICKYPPHDGGLLLIHDKLPTAPSMTMPKQASLPCFT